MCTNVRGTLLKSPWVNRIRSRRKSEARESIRNPKPSSCGGRNQKGLDLAAVAAKPLSFGGADPKISAFWRGPGLKWPNFGQNHKGPPCEIFGFWIWGGGQGPQTQYGSLPLLGRVSLPRLKYSRYSIAISLIWGLYSP